MATATYDRLWQEAMAELAEQVAIEDPTARAPPDAKPLPTVAISPNEAFEHFRTLYLRYIAIYRKLEQCFEGMIHPQKRVDARRIIDTVLTRLVQLRHTLVKWAPLNRGVLAATPGKPFPWEYLDYDDKVLELKIQPEAMELPVPRCYVDARYREHRDRDALVQGYMAKILGVDRVLVELEETGTLEVPGLSFSMAEAVAVIQRNERGRQGKQRAAVWKERRAEDAKAAASSAGAAAAAAAAGAPARRRGFVAASSSDEESSDDDDMTPEEAAVEIQRVARGFLARHRVTYARDAELVFIGMKDAPRPRLAALEAAMTDTVERRRLDQTAHREAYEKALKDMEAMVLEEDGPEMREKMRADRTAWWVSKLSEGTMPEDLSGYYAMLQAATRGEGAAAAEEEAAAEAAKGKGGKDKKGAKKDAKGKDAKPAAAAKGGKGKGKGKGDDDEEPEKPPALTGPSPWTKTSETLLRAYEATWVGRDEKDNVAQRHDAELAREIVRPAVEAAVEVAVNESLSSMLVNYRTQKLGADKKDKKDKKKKKKESKKKKKKEKALPGAKACGDMDWDKMLTVLIENRMVNNPRPSATFASFLGGANLLGSRYASTDTPAQRHPVYGFWVPQDPSMAQVREALMTYAVIPLGSVELRRSVDAFIRAHTLCGAAGLPKSILLYGPHGAGKTHLAQAIANATGSLFFNLSAGNVDGKMAQKDGHKMLLHMVFEVAKDASLAPCVIYIDEVEKLLPPGAGKKKAAASEAGPSRFKKDLLPYLKSLTPEHNVIVIGTSSEPWEADQKMLLECFNKHIYVPCPDYATRLRTWRVAVSAALATVPSSIDASTVTASALSTTAYDKPIGELPPWAAGGPISSMAAAARAGGGPAAGSAASSHPGGSAALEALMSAIPLTAASTSVASESTSALMDRLNFSSLAQVSNGYTCGSIRRAVRATLTPRRLERLGQRVLAESEFLTTLARCPRVYMEDNEKYRTFTDRITGYDVRREPPKEDDGKGKGKDKGKAKK